MTEAGTDEEPLPGGETADLSEFRERGLELGVVPESVEHCSATTAPRQPASTTWAAADRRLLRRLVPPHPAIEAEVLHAVRRELAQTVEDVMVRRLHLYYEHPERGDPRRHRVAELMGRELGWDDARIGPEARALRGDGEVVSVAGCGDSRGLRTPAGRSPARPCRRRSGLHDSGSSSGSRRPG